MSKRNFEVRAVWDDEAQVWFAESDIIGLHLEAETLEEFEALVAEYAAEMILENHLQDADISPESLRKTMPAIFVREPRAA